MPSALCPMPQFSRYIILFIAILCSVTIATSQRPLGSWSILDVKYEFDHHWSIWGEGQIRSLQFYDEFNYYEIKGGINYSLKEHVTFTVGAGHYQTYTSGGNFELPVMTDETRFWEQLTLESRLNRIIFEHRYRVEQRTINSGYHNRYRYRLNTTVPINHHSMDSKTIFGYIGDEVFFGDKAPFYQRNRFFTGLGYKFNSKFLIQSGYMRQYNYSIDQQASHDYLQVALFIGLQSKEFHTQSIPTSAD